jgi:DNA-binding transcriptional LysR family regulator
MMGGGVSMHLRQLEYFLAVAEELNFSRAAQKLHVSQQPISTQIQKLEQELGVKLFHRTTREVSLTPSGEAFLKEIRLAFKYLDKGKKMAQLSNEETQNQLKIGYEIVMMSHMLPAFIKGIRTKLPEVKLEIVELPEHVIHEKVISGDVDMGLMFTDKEFLDLNVLEKLKLGNERSVVTVSKEHPFAGKKTITLSDLSQEEFILIKREDKPYFFKKFYDICNEAGFEPKIAQEVPTEQALMSLVAKNMGIAMVFECLKKVFTQDLVYIPLVEPEININFGLIWKKDDENPMIADVCRIAEEAARDYQ